MLWSTRQHHENGPVRPARYQTMTEYRRDVRRLLFCIRNWPHTQQYLKARAELLEQPDSNERPVGPQGHRPAGIAAVHSALDRRGAKNTEKLSPFSFTFELLH
ncbi:hypothetical protein EVAR_62030_1 [Eumeta japonica]|uniref:Uncharacterized protein n=1 Tax=Eumeta variegata TaxID=151549 RepID=A0A4C1ZBE0_EUMVA|nr:hypothetical protein EVAR_62030_1 [Eumeta japonica]